MTDTSVLVIGATGTQGGAVARALLDRGSFDVHALTRDPSGEQAQALAKRGATVVEGDLADRGRLTELFGQVDAVFAVTDFWEHGYEDEVTQGTNVAEAAKEAGLEHLVYSSVGGAERATGIPHFDSKFVIEEKITDLGVPATIVRPVFFMQNLEGMREIVEGGQLASGLARSVSLQMVDVEVLGAFVATALDDPDAYIGQAVELASDELTLEAQALRFSSVTGRDVGAVHVPMDQFREQMGDEYAVMFEWFNEHGYEADLTALRRDHGLGLTTLEAYLEREGWGKLGQ